eukprot:gene3719-6607_t
MDSKTCQRCKKYYGPKEQDYLCSFCFAGNFPLSENKKKNFQKNWKENMNYALSKFQTFTNSEFQEFLNNLKVQSAEELFQLLIGLKEYKRIYLSAKQSNELFDKLESTTKKDTDDRTFYDLITVMFCYECFKMKRVAPNTKAPSGFVSEQSNFESEDFIYEMLKNWKYKHGKFLYYATNMGRNQNKIRFLTNCFLCSSDIFLLDDFDECFNCNRIMCQNCFDSISFEKILFGKKKMVLKKCRFCQSPMLKMISKFNDLNFIFH